MPGGDDIGHQVERRLVPPLRWTSLPGSSDDDLRIKYGADALGAAKALLQSYVAAEPTITADVLRAAGEGQSPIGLDSRLKSLESLTRKVRLRMARDDQPTSMESARTAALLCRDVSRYTIVADGAEFSSRLHTSVDAMEGQQWRLSSADNFFVVGNRYKGVHLQFEHDSGYALEMQFHTARSLQIKHLTDPLYVTVRGEDDASYNGRMAAYCRSIAASEAVSSPPGLEDVTALGEGRVALHRRTHRAPGRQTVLGETSSRWQTDPRGAVSAVMTPVSTRQRSAGRRVEGTVFREYR